MGIGCHKECGISNLLALTLLLIKATFLIQSFTLTPFDPIPLPLALRICMHKEKLGTIHVSPYPIPPHSNKLRFLIWRLRATHTLPTLLYVYIILPPYHKWNVFIFGPSHYKWDIFFYNKKQHSISLLLYPISYSPVPIKLSRISFWNVQLSWVISFFDKI